MSLHTAVASFRQVRHPDTADTILHDFETMLWVANVVNGLPALNSLRLKETLNQFAAPLKEQVRPLKDPMTSVERHMTWHCLHQVPLM